LPGIPGFHVHGAVLDERLQGRDHHIAGHRGQGVAVEELADVLGRADRVRAFFVQRGVVRGIRAFGRGQVRGVHGTIGILPLGGADEFHEVPGGLILAALLGQHETVDRRLDRVQSLDGELRERHEFDVRQDLRIGELLGEECAEQVHPGLLGLERFRGILPGLAQRGGVLVGQQRLPGVENVADFLLVPALFVRAQIHVELEAVQPHIEVVEGAHGRPAVLVRETDRDQTVLLHRGAERFEFVEGLRLGVAAFLPEAFAVEESPGVVVVGHQVLFAVRAGGCGFERIGEVAADLLPEVVDRGDQAFLRVVLHPVTGEPGEGVVRAALQVGIDLLLEVVVRNHVGGHGFSGFCFECSHYGVPGAAWHVIGAAGAEGQRVGGGRTAASAGGEQRQPGQYCGAESEAREQGAAVDVGCNMQCRHDFPFEISDPRNGVVRSAPININNEHLRS
jgi:hypothetical protein